MVHVKKETENGNWFIEDQKDIKKRKKQESENSSKLFVVYILIKKNENDIYFFLKLQLMKIDLLDIVYFIW